MALTRITKGVIKPNENYDTHNINSTGIVTAIGLDVNGNGDISGNLSVGGVLTYEDVTSIDSVGIITARDGIHVGAGVSAVGVGTFNTDIHIGRFLVHRGDTTTHLGFDVPNQIEFTAGNSERLRITNTGNVHFAGDQSGVNRGIIYNGPGYFGLFGSSSGSTKREIRFHSSSSGSDETLRISTGGNVAIYKDLDVDGHTNLDNVSIAGVTTHNGQSKFYGNGAAPLIWGDTGYTGHLSFDGSNNAVIRAASGKALIFQTDHVNERLRIDSSGRLLLGTTTEGHADADDFTIGTSTNSAGITIRTNTSGTGRLWFSDGTSGAAEYQGYVQYDHQNQQLIIGSGGYTNMKFLGSTDSNNIVIRLVNLSYDDGTIQYWNGGLYLKTGNSNGDRVLSFSTAGSERVRIDSSGRLLVGTTTAPNNANTDDFTLATSGHTGFTIRSGTTHDGQIAFSDGTSGADEYRGQVLYNHGSNYMRFVTNGTERLRITSGGALQFNSTAMQIHLNTSDGSDNGYMNIGAAGGANNQNRGAQVVFYGNEHSSYPGQCGLLAGNSGNAAGYIYFKTGGTERLRITSGGEAHFYGNQTNTPEGDFGFRWDRNTYANFQLTNTNNTSVNAGARVTLKTNVGNITGTYYNNGGFYLVNSANGYFNYYSNSVLRININTNGDFFLNPDNANGIPTSNGQVGKRFGIKSTQNNVIIGETTSSGNVGLMLESRVTGRSGGARSSQIELANGVMRFYTAASGADVTERLRITSTGVVQFKDNQGTYTNTVHSHSGEAGFITHYTARTTYGGADLYRRMLDIASGGANPHGSSIRFLTSDNNSNPATCIERMRIMDGGGVFIGTKTHTQRYSHAESPALLTVQNGARVTTSSSTYAAPKGGFCDYARYELEQKLISFSTSNVQLTQARNGQPLTINNSRDAWAHYSNLPNYLLGHAATDNINNTNFTLTLYANMTVFLLRTNGWNSVDLTNWNLIESDTQIGPASSDTRLYVKSLAAGTYTNFDNDSAMYFFVL